MSDIRDKLMLIILGITISILGFYGGRFIKHSDQSLITSDNQQQMSRELQRRANWMEMMDDLGKDNRKDIHHNMYAINEIKSDIKEIKQDTAHIPVLLSKLDMMEQMLSQQMQRHAARYVQHKE